MSSKGHPPADKTKSMASAKAPSGRCLFQHGLWADPMPAAPQCDGYCELFEYLECENPHPVDAPVRVDFDRSVASAQNYAAAKFEVEHLGNIIFELDSPPEFGNMIPPKGWQPDSVYTLRFYNKDGCGVGWTFKTAMS